MELKPEEIKQAIELGREAWEREDEAIPGRDPDLMALIGNGPSTAERNARSVSLMKAWLRGWRQLETDSKGLGASK